mmetsp:Transcript_23469/g.41258  ORF Transcript_23469/g.41258 Transcript_23469/m.41258 type:complete len:214 (-) Transcript_23469:1632-2273(-)
MQSSSVRHIEVGFRQHNCTICIRETQNQHLGHKGPDLARRKVHNGQDLLAYQSLGRVMHSDLGRGLFLPQLGAKIDPHLDGGLAGLRKGFGAHNASHAHIDLEEVVKADLIHGPTPLTGWWPPQPRAATRQESPLRHPSTPQAPPALFHWGWSRSRAIAPDRPAIEGQARRHPRRWPWPIALPDPRAGLAPRHQPPRFQSNERHRQGQNRSPR